MLKQHTFVSKPIINLNGVFISYMLKNGDLIIYSKNIVWFGTSDENVFQHVFSTKNLMNSPAYVKVWKHAIHMSTKLFQHFTVNDMFHTLLKYVDVDNYW